LTFTIPIKPRFPVQSYIFQKLYQGWAWGTQFDQSFAWDWDPG
jgi:hypothetical protein